MCQKVSKESYLHNRKMKRSPSVYLICWDILPIVIHFASEFFSENFLYESQFAAGLNALILFSHP